MKDIDEEIVFVVKRLAKAVSKHGVKKVVQVLDQLNNEEAFIEAHKALIKFILKETSAKFNLNPDDLKKNNIRGVIIDARNICCVLLKKHLDLKHMDIAGLFGSVNHSIVSNAIRNFEGLSYDVKTDRCIIDVFNDVDAKTLEKKNILWMKHGSHD